MSIVDDLQLEGAPEKEFNPGVAGRLPRKRIAAGALIRNRGGEILFVVPNYKPGLDIPGGIAEEGEQPKAACIREVAEETGLALPVGDLLVVDWVPRHGVWGDAVMFIFDGGEIGTIPGSGNIDPELDGLVMLSLADASYQLRPSMVRRLSVAIDAAETGRTIYAEFGRPV
ncbi:NUDIX hydrolase [Actinoplanes sp. ATCC 53533]|uniref:NUDIX domain-containing protein n=1 Tax=Actinoplanes sp. ATCC 53533 TaxID=1288362 RepID=UPI000F76ADE9|nr:NUDIX hydrolase [Actinoplanes sp. ATCC 53533]RSM59463.1 NUDIX hydrolase [Actinoplanes sp. ATCC 53533]